jgi:GNAT superfamily N-acetyltransferase
MKLLSWNAWRRRALHWARPMLAALPERLRFALYRRAVECDPVHGDRLELKIAETEAELEACFKLLHDAYVASGFMQPHPSGLRVTPYHALPTTTTLCAKIDGQVVGTLSIVREGVFGFPMQSVFDIAAVRAKGGRLAEISALAIHPRFRRTGGSILFPLMKFMYEYCTQYFDTRHLLIAVNPAHIEMYESLLFFRRLTEAPVDRYDFVNGAPAVGATLDLEEAPELFRRAYAHKPGRRNLHRFFVQTRLPAIRFPSRTWHVSNDPVLTPALLDHFFNHRTDAMALLDERRLRLLHAIYPGADWARVLPPMPAAPEGAALRRHPRYSTKCPATLQPLGVASSTLRATLVEISAEGFQARVHRPLRVGTRCAITTELGPGVRSQVSALVVREVTSDSGQTFGFHVAEPDAAWQRCVNWLERNGPLPADGLPVAPAPTRPARPPEALGQGVTRPLEPVAAGELAPET